MPFWESYILSFNTCCGPILRAVEEMSVNSMEPVLWMFKTDEGTEKVIETAMEGLLKVRDKCAAWLPLLKALEGVSTAMPSEDSWGRSLFDRFLKDVEDWVANLNACCAACLKDLMQRPTHKHVARPDQMCLWVFSSH